MPTFAGIDHFSFSVRDADKTAKWWQEVFGLEPLLTIDEERWRAVLLWFKGDQAIEFQQHDANAGEPFDPTRTGLDHIGFGVESREELDQWQAHFERLGVVHTPVVERRYGSFKTVVLTFKDPDRIQFEMIYVEGEPAS